MIAVSVNLSGMTQGNVGVNNDDSAVDNTIIEYAKNGYKPLYAAPSGMKQGFYSPFFSIFSASIRSHHFLGPMKLGSLPKTYILTEIGFTKL